jgi:hypothetical protein
MRLLQTEFRWGKRQAPCCEQLQNLRFYNWEAAGGARLGENR